MESNIYVVTVTPKKALSCGGWTAGEYSIEVTAKDRETAIKRARAGYEDSRINPAKFTARKKKTS